MSADPDGPQPERQGRLRLAALAVLLVGGAGLIGLLARTRPSSPLPSSLATPFQLLGTPVQLADRLTSRAIPVGSLQERQLGDTFRRRYAAQIQPGDADQAYLDGLMPPLRRHARRPFPYRAFLIGRCGSPNAWALPVGVILVSQELLEQLDSEAELMAVLGHELGHIELGHSFDAVRFQLLGRRSGSERLGQLADGAARLLLQQSYSKAAEHEADDYAYALLLSSRYDPAAQGRAFAALNRAHGGRDRAERHADPLRDLLRSHPPGALRQADYAQRAAAWWRQHPTERRYVGAANLQRRQPLGQLDLAQEWVGGAREPAQAAR
ncbi:M48 family metallopeptidase [Synechococcus sp. GreenBA-s]|nr:M48 family metallopeptidase [Synechococcus sp. GreenBA-s]